MSSDGGFGHLLIALRQLALKEDPHLEDEINRKSTAARAQLEADLQRAREIRLAGGTPEPIGGEYMRFLLNNDDRVDLYRRFGGQLELLDPRARR